MQKSLGAIFVLCVCGMFFIAQTAQAVEFERARVQVNSIELEVEYALTFEQRATGLMHRKSMCSDCGMLFKYSRERVASMWMKNTYIPLDVAFVDQDGKIIDIKTMKPLDLTSVSSTKKVLYALEMNQGWFEKNGVKEGHFISFSLPEKDAKP